MDKEGIEEFTKRFPQWEEVKNPVIIKHIARSYTPIETNSSLHVYEEKYNIQGETYRFLYSVSEHSFPNIEKLIK
jgi:hypothetical protein